MRSTLGLAALLCTVAAEPDASILAQKAQPPSPKSPGATPFADTRALSVMKDLFTKPASVFTSDKAILSLAQGKPIAGQAAPQTLAPFLAPYAPPATSTVAAWTSYNWMMMSFWYRFKYGFAVFQAQTKDQSPWLKAAISYFDLLANGYWAANMFLQIYSTLEVLKTPATDAKSYATVYMAWVELRQAYTFLYWLFFQNTMSLLDIQAAVGVPVETKVHDYYKGMTPYLQNYAFMHLDVAVDLKRYHLFTDGKAFDTSKMNKAFELWYIKRFVHSIRSLTFGQLSAAHPMKNYIGSLAPWIGFGLSNYGFMWSYFSYLNAAPAAAGAKPATIAGQAATGQAAPAAGTAAPAHR